MSHIKNNKVAKITFSYIEYKTKTISFYTQSNGKKYNMYVRYSCDMYWLTADTRKNADVKNTLVRKIQKF